VLGAPGDPAAEAWRAADELERDATAGALSAALPDDATVVVLGWPEQTSGALRRRGDVRALVVDAAGEGHGLVRRLEAAGVDARLVEEAGLGAAAAASDLVVLEASALGPGGLVATSGSRAAAAVARHAGVPVWAVAGVGRVLPARLWAALAGRLERAGEPWELVDEIVPLDLVDVVVGPAGAQPPADAVRRADCPVVPELLKETV
jgi:translation initiation factor 2B subunit (eIF-2B alpha/beta/delta family)